MPIGFHILRMETKHTIAVAWILLAEATYGLYGTGVDGWNEQLDRSSIFATLDNEVEVFAEFLAIKVSMSVYIVQGFKSLRWFMSLCTLYLVPLSLKFISRASSS